MKALVVAIDGPAGSGKSTLARRLALELGLPYVNTGLMYRALTLRALDEGLDPEGGPALAARAKTLDFDLDRSVSPPELRIDGHPPDPRLTSPEVESTVSRVAAHPEVRTVMRDEQRRLAEGGAVMEGRDIGSVVVPGAAVKLYLEAHPEQRAARRAEERIVPADGVAKDLERRDALDARTNPLEPAPDAILLDTTVFDEQRTFDAAMAVVRARLEASS